MALAVVTASSIAVVGMSAPRASAAGLHDSSVIGVAGVLSLGAPDHSRLVELRDWIGPADGRYGGLLTQGLMAFQKGVGLARTGVADAATVDALAVPVPPQALTTVGDVLEVDKTRQLLFVVVGGQTVSVFNVSTGSEIPFVDRSPITRRMISGDAVTYAGQYSIYFDRPDGWRVSDLGRLWRPKYFNAGIDFHGSPDVPGHPVEGVNLY